MKKKKIRTLYNRALSMALVVSTTASLCLGVSGVTAAMEEQRRAEEATEEVVSGERHHHTFACYEEYELDCTENHSENEHRKSCYRYSGERICGLEDGDLHLHGPECEVAAKVLICGEDEDASGEILDEEGDKTTDGTADETADNEGAGESTADDGSVGGGIADDGIEGGEVTDGGAEGGEVAGDGIGGDETAGGGNAGGEMVGDEIAGDEIGGGETTGDEIAGGEIAGDDIAGDETNNGEDNTTGNTGEEMNGSDSVESSKEAADSSDGAGEETLESGSAGEETAGSVDAGKETAGSVDAGKETTGSADAGKETTGSVDAEGSKEETNASGNAGEESSSGSNDKETADIENAGEETAASDSAGKETAGAEGTGKETAGAEGVGKETVGAESAGKESAGSESAGGGNSGSGEWNNGGETSYGEKTNISAVKSGRDRFSLLAVNQHSYSSVLFPQLYIGNPLNALLDKILPEEELLAGEDGTGNATDNEIDNESETVNDETERTEDADNGKGHQHSEECYKIIYQCRAGVATMALREGGVANEGDLRRAITNSSGATTINIVGDFDITSTIEVSSGKNITIDLQGHTLTYNGTNATDSMFKVDGGTLTIKDSANAQQGAKKISEEIVSEAEEASYDETTGRLTYYVTECSVNLDGKSTTNTVRKYVYDLGTTNNVGMLKSNGLDALISVYGGAAGKLIIEGGKITNEDGKHGIYIDSGYVDIKGGYLVGNGQYAGIYEENSTIKTSPTLNGGAIWIKSGGLNVLGGVIANNNARHGGGIYEEGWPTVNITGGFIANNHSGISGGGIYGLNGIIQVSDNASIIGNLADYDGGGISYANSNPGNTSMVLKITGGCIAGNESGLKEISGGKNGGGVYLEAAKFNNVIEGNAVISNNISNNGGGVCLSNSKMTLGGNASIVANKADIKGGGIYCIGADGEGKIGDKVIIAGNTVNGELNSLEAEGNDALTTLPTFNGYIEQGEESVGAIPVANEQELKNEIQNTTSTNKVIELEDDIILNDPIIIDDGIDVTILLNGNDIEPSENYNTGDNKSLFIVEGKAGQKSYLIIKNTIKDENRTPDVKLIQGPVTEFQTENVGRAGSYDGNTITYYLTKSEPYGSKPQISTQETTYQYTITLNDENSLDRIGSIKGNEGNKLDSIISAGSDASVTIEGGIITGAKHGIKLENKAAMV